MALINILIIIVLSAVVAILPVNAKGKGIITVSTVIVVALISSFFAIKALMGNSYEIVLSGTILFGSVPVRIDALSAWFILTINFTIITGAVYGFNYMKKYRERTSDITMHCIAFLFVQIALLGICSVQNGFIFLLLWELMAISVFILVIFEHEKPETIKAGTNYIVQSHVSIVFIMVGFIYVAYKTGSYSFEAIAEFSGRQSTLAGTALFLCFFIGFAIKAGFVPFHTWLPYAHPAAPSHVSGIMSGVVIKIGIYGILRMLLLIKTDYNTIGYIILFISIFTGIYGVMLATIQHNLKKLLAYHSIENIGIIGIGIGLGCIGLGSANKWVAILGFSGALLHTLNHSLFKSLLFYCAGNVYQAAHTVNIERLGGLIKKMPRTSILFLVAAIAICGLPPLNGFISEFLIFGGLYNWLYSANLISLIAIVFALGGLVLIGGLALLCFTKAFSIVFLGNPRNVSLEEIHETGFRQLFPMYMTVSLMIIIGLFPSFFIDTLQRPVNLFTRNIDFNLNFIKVGTIDSLKIINWLFLALVVFVIAVIRLRKYVTREKIIEKGATWGCGYAPVNSKLQYTAGSYVRSYSKLAKPLLEIEKKGIEIIEVFPSEKRYETDPYDKIEHIFIDKPLKLLTKITDLFLFLQNGRLQRYILYGIVFITAVICLPLIIDKILAILHFLNNL
ncbi:MAG: proton-conducting transporter membrane subunit [Bacteroidota bacterium]